MKRKMLGNILALGMTFALLAGCASQSGSAPAAASTGESVTADAVSTEAADTASTEAANDAADADTRVVTDLTGNELEVPATVDTIVSLAPSTTDLLLDLGLSAKIVAVDTYSMDSYGTELPDGIPAFDMMNPDNEQIVALSPDIVFTTGMSYAWGEDVFASAREAGVFIVDIESQATLQEIVDSIIFIGDCVGEREAAEVIAEDMDVFLNDVQDAVAEIGDAAQPVVLFEMNTPSADFPTLYSAGPGSYIDEIIALTGGVNAAGDTDTPWPVLTEEAAIAANPDVILTTDDYTPDVENVILSSEGWENVNAVANKQVFLIDANKINRPNHHVCESILEVLELLYPETEFDLESPFAETFLHAA